MNNGEKEFQVMQLNKKQLEGLVEYIRVVGRKEKRKEVSGFFLNIMEQVLTYIEYDEWRSECK